MNAVTFFSEPTEKDPEIWVVKVLSNFGSWIKQSNLDQFGW